MKPTPATRYRMPLAAATLLALAVLAADTARAGGGATTQDDDLRTLIDEVVEYGSRDRKLALPEGVDERYADRLNAVSSIAFDAEATRLEEFRQRLGALDTGTLSPGARIDALVLSSQLRDRVTELRHRGYLLPIGSRYGFHFSFGSLPESHRFASVDDYDDYIARMQSFLEHSRQQIALMREGIAAGFTLPAAVLDGYANTAAVHLVDNTADSTFAAPLDRIPDAVSPEERERIQRDGLQAIADSVLPGFTELAAFLRDEYIPAGRSTLGVTDLPDGRSYYEHRVRMYTTLELSPEQVHEIGLAETARIRTAMEAIMAEVGFAGSYLEFVEFLRTDPRFYATTADEYLAAVAFVAKQMEGHLPELFRLLPRTPYGVRAIPAHVAPRQSAGYYDGGAGDGTRAGWININTSELDSRPLYVTRALAFHEGVPGHHLQIMLTRENEELSTFRRRSGVTAFVEGWGLYAERLGGEVGLYSDPYDRFGMWSYQIWRACRLVVDTGMHALGWSREQAIDFMADNTGMARGPVTAEIDRHITEPGQGLAYKIGELKITELRAHAEQRLGENFDVREFHDVVLRNGPLPLWILEEEVERYIETALAPAPH